MNDINNLPPAVNVGGVGDMGGAGEVGKGVQAPHPEINPAAMTMTNGVLRHFNITLNTATPPLSFQQMMLIQKIFIEHQTQGKSPEMAKQEIETVIRQDRGLAAENFAQHLQRQMETAAQENDNKIEGIKRELGPLVDKLDGSPRSNTPEARGAVMNKLRELNQCNLHSNKKVDRQKLLNECQSLVNEFPPGRERSEAAALAQQIYFNFVGQGQHKFTEYEVLSGQAMKHIKSTLDDEDTSNKDTVDNLNALKPHLHLLTMQQKLSIVNDVSYRFRDSPRNHDIHEALQDVRTSLGNAPAQPAPGPGAAQAQAAYVPPPRPQAAAAPAAPPARAVAMAAPGPGAPPSPPQFTYKDRYGDNVDAQEIIRQLGRGEYDHAADQMKLLNPSDKQAMLDYLSNYRPDLHAKLPQT